MSKCVCGSYVVVDCHAEDIETLCNNCDSVSHWSRNKDEAKDRLAIAVAALGLIRHDSVDGVAIKIAREALVEIGEI